MSKKIIKHIQYTDGSYEIVEVYESDPEVLKLACAFAPVKELLDDKRISVIFDKNGLKWEERKSVLREDEKLCVHMPSQTAASL